MMIGLPACSTTCGNVSVPYPFGMGPRRCYHSPGFNLTCDYPSNGKPPRLLLGDGAFEVIHISLENNTMRVASLGLQDINVSDSGGRYSWSLGGVPLPFILEQFSNEFILSGCNVQATLLANGSIVSGCASFCALTVETQILGLYEHDGSKTCSNIGCCQSSILMGYEAYDVELKRLDRGLPVENLMNSGVDVLIAEAGWFDEKLAMDLHSPNLEFVSRRKTGLLVPVILHWAVPHGEAFTDYDKRPCPADAARATCKSVNSQCRYVGQSTLRGYSCQCKEGYDGNPYITAGCQDINECDRKEEHRCFGDCEELPGTFRCRCPEGFQGNYTIPGGCFKSVNPGHSGLIIGLSVASGPCMLVLVLGTLLIIRELKQRKAKALRRKFFTQNRGQLLKQLVSHRSDIAERMVIPLEELQKATNNFDQTRRLGGGGHGTVYKGILSDLHVVAIKKSNIVVKREIDEFINEVAILSQINHRNIVKLHGCCLESEVPLLAYEFISNGTLSDHLHTEAPRSLPWEERLRITTEIGKALAYLHSAVTIPVIHRDIKPCNILLDDALTAKVSDFGASRYILVDQTGVVATTAVQGTIGYLDPMYYYTGQLTESSDVYSFGVLIVELLTRRKPSLYISSEGDGLVMQFVTLLAEGNLAKILDPQVVEEGGNEVKEVATLAMSCLKLRTHERPTMRQVEMALEALQTPKEVCNGSSVI
ncbi:wall-associated receptor kinase 4-like [Lolium perenne]|uniref:wall-associated receptor kinase 4-like n=1 Tax=Lolium perenne TaxID=4522 RepID=UPI003A99ED51